MVRKPSFRPKLVTKPYLQLLIEICVTLKMKIQYDTVYAMLQPSPHLFRLQVPLLSQWTCHSCRIKAQRTRLCQQISTTPPTRSTSRTEASTDDDHDLKTLSHPLGQPHPPQLRENSGIDSRPWVQRRDDFFNYDKHLKRREEL